MTSTTINAGASIMTYFSSRQGIEPPIVDHQAIGQPLVQVHRRAVVLGTYLYLDADSTLALEVLGPPVTICTCPGRWQATQEHCTKSGPPP